jgi:hypothetical protein
MVGLAQGGHHLTLNELPTAMAACPVHSLVVQGAEILSVLYEEAPLGQVTATHCRKTRSLLVTICRAAGQYFPSPECWLCTVISMVWGRGGDWYKELFIVGLCSLSCLPPLGSYEYLIQVNSMGWVSTASVGCLRLGGNQTVFDGKIHWIQAISDRNKGVSGSDIRKGAHCLPTVAWFEPK